ncbi:UDP-glucose/GDP-mannose dehydrogenase family protein [soil metagenome]
MAVICVAGEWHQAIVVSAALARLGHEVRGAVSAESVAGRLNSGEPPVHEPELPELMKSGVAAGTLHYTASYEDALRGADYAFIALDTPVDDDDVPELGDVLHVARQTGRGLTGDIALVITAQVPVGTCERLREIVAQESGRAVQVAHVPEFLRLGQAVRTFFDADRFIIGTDDAGLGSRLEELYAPLNRPVLRMDLRSAEMTKHASNAFLAASISFANEIADLCDAAGADIGSVIEGMKLDARIGPRAYLSAGLGFAGGTLGRDVRALQGIGRATGRATHLGDAVMQINRSRPDLVRRQLAETVGQVEGMRVCVLGMTYKPGTSTMRRSIGLQIIRDLVGEGAVVSAYDPLADMSDVEAPPPFRRGTDPYEAAADADAVVLVTEWEGIDALDFVRLRSQMRGVVFLDTRNLLEPQTMTSHGFRYLGVGRGRRGASGANGGTGGTGESGESGESGEAGEAGEDSALEVTR